MSDIELHETLYQVNNRLATITLNRPHRANAWTGVMHTEYRALLHKADIDPEVGVIIVTGADDYFCVGADIDGLEVFADTGEYDAGTGPDLVTPGSTEFAAFRHDYTYHLALSKPVISAINGPMAGVGFVLACYTDIRFAVSGIKFTAAHGPLNLPVECGLSWLLPRLIGGSRAAELLISSRKFYSEEAERIGLVHRLSSKENLMSDVRAYALELVARNSPESLRQSKRQVYIDLHRDLGVSTVEAGELLKTMMTQANYREGVNALIEKRSPNWRAELVRNVE